MNLWGAGLDARPGKVPERAGFKKGFGVVARVGIDGRKQLAALLFEPGMRPDIEALSRVAATGRYSLSMRPDPAHGWVELFRDGLTFDLAGLAPSPPVAAPAIQHRYGLGEGLQESGLEALGLLPGPHLAGAEGLLPVVRVAAELLIELSTLPGVAGIAWLAAENLVAPEWFERSVKGWLDNGPFAAFALVSLARQDDLIVSQGLKLLTGQEFTLAAAPGTELTGAAMGTAVRLLDWLVAHGKLSQNRVVELVGTGPVELIIKDKSGIAARCS